MKSGGFDIVIGNPPYVQIQGMEKELKEGYKEANYKNYVLTGDIYQLFFEKGLDVLKIGGIVGMITSNKWMRAGYGAVTRDYFYRNANVNGVIDLGAGRFKGATVDTNIILYSKKDDEIKINEPREFKAIKFYDDLVNLKDLEFKNDIVIANHDKEWVIMNNLENSIFEKIIKHKPLKDWNVNLFSGIKTGFNEIFIIDDNTREELIKKDVKNSEIIKPVLVDDSLLKYRINFNNKYLINTHNGVKSENIPPIDINNYKDIKTYIDNSVEEIKKGVMKRKGGHTTNNKSFFDRSDMGYTPYNHRNCAYLLEFEKPKIVWKQTSKYQTFMLDTEGYYITVSAHMLTINDNDLNKLKYILSILNSKLFKYYMFSVATNFSGVGIRWIPAFIENVPIPEPDKDTENKLVNLVDNIIDLNKKLSSEKNPNTIEMLNTRIQAVDAAIDKIVYSLYNLADEEIRVIEGE